ncbi:MAG TPA: T9SS type A sorting domain-containing protein [Segetibacter sp.]
MKKIYLQISAALTFFVVVGFFSTKAVAQDLIIQSGINTSELVGGGSVGICFINNEYWISKWYEDSLYRLTPSGAIIDRFVIPGVTAVRGMTWDGTFIYASLATNSIAKINPLTKTLVGTITAPIAVRQITYSRSANNNAGGLWIGNYSTDLILISMNGTTLQTIPAQTHGLIRMYGSAYDSTTTDGGPYLWISDYKDSSTAINFYRIPISTGIPNYKYNILQDFPNIKGGLAGGVFMSFDINPGKKTLVSLTQTNPNLLVRYLVPTILPVTIATFTGEVKDLQNVLKWTTASEQNNKGFEVQRSADGSAYFKVGFIESKAFNFNSNSNINYSFNDEHPLKGDNYYRLMQVDIDGKTTYSSIVVLKRLTVIKAKISNIYPNPTSSLLNISLNAPAINKMMLIVTDIKGAILVKQTLRVNAGDNSFNIKTQNLKAGTYFLKVFSQEGENVGESKFVKQ